MPDAPLPIATLGTVEAIRGAVLDVVFAAGALPPINSALLVQWDQPTPLVLEVHSHLDQTTLRAVAFRSTAGLARGTKVQATGAPVSVPVGRLLDVLGQPKDYGPALPAARHPPRRSPPRLAAPRSSRPASRSSTCSPRWPKAARPRCSVARASAKPCW